MPLLKNLPHHHNANANIKVDAKVNVNELAQRLQQARLEGRPVEPLSKGKGMEGSLGLPPLALHEAYAIQERGIQFRREEGGEVVIGSKMGLTSEVKRRQMNLSSPIYGILTDKMKCESGGILALEGLIHPKIEPELAFIMGRDLEGTVGREEALQACEGVCAALEILDSRYLGFKYFSLEDVVADNASSSHFVLGEERFDPRQVDTSHLSMEMRANGKVVQRGTSQAISGDPILSIIQQCELLAKRGQKIRAKSIVLAGAATPAVALGPGQTIELRVEHLGRVSLRVR